MIKARRRSWKKVRTKEQKDEQARPKVKVGAQIVMRGDLGVLCEMNPKMKKASDTKEEIERQVIDQAGYRYGRPFIRGHLQGS